MRIDIHQDIVLGTISDDSMRHSGLPRLDSLILGEMFWRELDIDRFDVGQDVLTLRPPTTGKTRWYCTSQD
jgi:hypothetical protein